MQTKIPFHVKVREAGGGASVKFSVHYIHVSCNGLFHSTAYQVVV